MKNYTITKEQIKKLSTQDQIVEEYLNKWFPEAFKKELEIGKWYISKDINKHIFYVTNITEDRYYYYGFNSGGQWCKNDDYSFNDSGLKNGFRLATEEELKSALIKEAERRGFKKGAKFKSSISENGELNPHIFKDGVWAEVIKSKYYTKAQAEKRLTELENDGYEYEIID